jgi:hypothetical protein
VSAGVLIEAVASLWRFGETGWADAEGRPHRTDANREMEQRDAILRALGEPSLWASAPAAEGDTA